MKVLFISSGNSKTGISTITLNQGKSLEELGVEIQYFTIKGKGFIGYARNLLPLRRVLKKNKFDLVHAHFSLSAFVASLAGASPLVVSLMGWNVKVGMTKRLIILFNRFFWDVCIAKSNDMKLGLGIESIIVLPNGVDFEKFKPIPKQIAVQKLGWDPEVTHILFAADPSRPIKNYELTKRALDLLALKDFKLHVLENVPNDLMVYYYNASSVAILSSFDEGSPNVIKEAMACNCPIVTTNVGDVKDVIKDTEGCFITAHNAIDMSKKIEAVLKAEARTNGREKIQHLDSTLIAEKLKQIYESVLKTKSSKS
jgi:teichuronic acid biosynthesis glycosyltransferase TuaC